MSFWEEIQTDMAACHVFFEKQDARSHSTSMLLVFEMPYFLNVAENATGRHGSLTFKFRERRRVLIITQSACFWEYKDMYAYRRRKEESRGIQAIYIPSLGADA
jgi:hypothetical protein